MGVEDAIGAFIGDAASDAVGNLAAAVLTAAGLRVRASFRRPDPIQVAFADAVQETLAQARWSPDADPSAEWVDRQLAVWSPIFTSDISPSLLAALRYEGDGDDPAQEQFAVAAAAAMELRQLDRADLNREVEVEEFLFQLPRHLREILSVVAQSGRRDLREQVESLIGRPVDAPAGRRRVVSPQEYRQDLTVMMEGIDRAAREELLDYLPAGVDAIGLTLGVRVQPRRRPHDGDDGRPIPVHPWSDMADHPRLVVVADAGMGKSWLVRTESSRLARVGLVALEGRVSATDIVVPVPIRCDEFVDLASRQTAPGGLAAVAVHWLQDRYGLDARSAPRLCRQIERGHAVLLLDALDELSGQTRQRCLELIRNWAQATPGGRYLITSRNAGYTGVLVHQRPAEEFDLLPFTDDDIDAALTVWLPDAAADRIRRRLDDPSIAAMATIPLLLTLLCVLAREGKELPTRRAALYDLILRRFLAHEHRPPAADGIEVGRLLAILAPLAFRFADRSEGWVDLMSGDDLLRELDGGPADSGADAYSLLRQLSVRDGILVFTGGPESGYRFVHRTIAEWLVARHLAGRPSAEWLEAIDEHLWFDPAWAGTIPLVAAELERGLGGRRRQPKTSSVRQLVRHLLDQSCDPARHALFVAVRTVAELADPEAALSSADLEEMAHRTLAGLLDESTRDTATDALVAAGPTLPRQFVDQLMAALADGGVDVQQSAAEALGGCPGAEVTRALLDALSTGEPLLRWAAGRALSVRPGEDVTRGLLAAFTHGNPDTQTSALAALEQRAGAEVTSALLASFTEGDPFGRVRVALALGGRPDTEVTSALIAALADRDHRVQHNATLALTRQRGPEVTATLLTALATADGQIRNMLMQALHGRPGREVTGVLLAGLTDLDGGVRRSAAYALAGRPGVDVTRGLLAALTDDDVVVRDRTVQALLGRDGEEVTDALLGALADRDDPSEQISALRGLEGRPDHGVTDALLALLSNGRMSVRWNAAAALRGRPEEGVTRALLDALNQSDEYLHHHAIRALAGRPEKEVTTALLTALASGTTTVRRTAAEALEEHRGEDVTAALLAALTDREVSVRDAAALSLANSPEGLLAAGRLIPTAGPAVRETLDYAAASLLAPHYRTLEEPERTQVRAAFAALTEENHRRPLRYRRRRAGTRGRR